mmetsp:Transcript_11744/g.26204  ORF Transcript_11744/g.26204 Transcript_11744/m.26204 type:complete len:271 (-) Transcript_11744:65-877(-)
MVAVWMLPTRRTTPCTAPCVVGEDGTATQPSISLPRAARPAAARASTGPGAFRWRKTSTQRHSRTRSNQAVRATPWMSLASRILLALHWKHARTSSGIGRRPSKPNSRMARPWASSGKEHKKTPSMVEKTSCVCGLAWSPSTRAAMRASRFPASAPRPAKRGSPRSTRDCSCLRALSPFNLPRDQASTMSPKARTSSSATCCQMLLAACTSTCCKSGVLAEPGLCGDERLLRIERRCFSSAWHRLRAEGGRVGPTAHWPMPLSRPFRRSD